MSVRALRRGTMAGRGAVAAATPPAYRASTHDAGASVASTSLTVPGTVVTNDVMLVAVGWYYGGGRTITPPAGWTLVREDAQDVNLSIKQTVYRRTAQAGEASTVYTWTFSPNTWVNSMLVAYSGVSTAAPVNVHGAATRFSDTDLYSASVTTTVDQTRVIEFFMAFANDSDHGGTMSAPATVRETNKSFDRDQIASDQTQAVAGATPVKNATVGPSGGLSMVTTTVALTPA